MDEDLWIEDGLEDLMLGVPGEFEEPVVPVPIRKRGSWRLVSAPGQGRDEEILLL